MKKLLSFILAMTLIIGISAAAQAAPVGFGYAEMPLYASYREPTAPNEVRAVSQILDAFENAYTSVDISSRKIKTEELPKLYFGAIYNNPEYFYIKLSYSYTYNPMTGTVMDIKIQYLDKYYDSSENLDTGSVMADKAVFDAAKAEILGQFDDEMSDVEKVLAVHDYLGSINYYDYDNYLAGSLPEESFTAYGALVNGTCVCQGYSLAFNLICRELGITSVYVSSEEDNHGWNMVQLDGRWYHLDITFDDPVYTYGEHRLLYSDLGHSYFLISDADLSDGSHDGFDLPEDPGAAPSAGETMEGIWQGIDSAMIYHDGYWYYCENDKIIKSRIDGSSRSVFYDGADSGLRLASYGGRLYYSDYSGIYSMSFDGTDRQCLYSAEDERIYGLYCRDGIVHFETIGETDDKWQLKTVPAVLSVLLGDADNNGVVNVSDMIYIKNLIMTENWSEEQLKYADCNMDGVLTVSDIIMVKNIIMQSAA